MPEIETEVRLTRADIEAIKDHVVDTLQLHNGWSLEGARAERAKLARDFRHYAVAWSQGIAVGGEVFLDYQYTVAALDAIIACLLAKEKTAQGAWIPRPRP